MQGPTSHLYFSQRLRLHYVTWGEENAPALLLIHGGRDHCRNWDWVAERLADRYHIVAPDLRGHGDSEWASGGSYSEINFVYDVAQLVHCRLPFGGIDGTGTCPERNREGGGRDSEQ